MLVVFPNPLPFPFLHHPTPSSTTPSSTPSLVMSLNKLALITGGTRGIGRATALALAAKSYDLALSYASSAKDFETTKALVDALGTGVRVAGFKADLGEADESKRVVDEVVAEFGKVDVLINNAVSARVKQSGEASATC